MGFVTGLHLRGVGTGPPTGTPGRQDTLVVRPTCLVGQYVALRAACMRDAPTR